MTTTQETGASKAMYKITEAARLLSLSRSVVYEQIRAGRLLTVKEGRARLVPAEAITAYVKLLIRESGVDIAQAS
jgi:excisionase family DNA binding protein